MRFGIFLPSHAPDTLDPQHAIMSHVGQACLAESLGFDSVWLPERRLGAGCIAGDPLSYAAHLAGRTSHLRIGVGASMLPLYDPVGMAERCAMVDTLTAGRLNVGLGWPLAGQHLELFGISQNEIEARLRESLRIMIRLWTEDVVNHDGKYWQLRDVTLSPKPVQKPHPPLFMMTAGTEWSVQIAAEHAMPLVQGMEFVDAGQVVSLYQRYREVARTAGLSSAEVDALLDASYVAQKVYVNASRAEATRAPEPYAMWQHGNAVSHVAPASKQNGGAAWRTLRPIRRVFTGNGRRDFHDMTWEELREYDLYGSPADLTQKMERLQDAGARGLLCWFAYGGMPDAMVRETMEHFARDIMPAFQRRQSYRRLRR
jgi:alkanesulfonate monooxygenase SsuD/methylene tetrahydromethanopterin reductase-like flavin-dependent oxidoreductase (luciferase family)